MNRRLCAFLLAASLLDVAPLLAYLAGAAIPDDLEGSLPEHWIRPEHLAAHPVS